MKILRQLLSSRKNRRRSFEAYKDEVVVNQAREQFKKLADRGLSVPVAYL